MDYSNNRQEIDVNTTLTMIGRGSTQPSEENEKELPESKHLMKDIACANNIETFRDFYLKPLQGFMLPIIVC